MGYWASLGILAAGIPRDADILARLHEGHAGEPVKRGEAGRIGEGKRTVCEHLLRIEGETKPKKGNAKS